MLVLLPPSEGKTPPRRGSPLDLASLRLPALGEARERVLGALVTLASEDPDAAAAALDLGPTQRDLVERDAALRSAPTARADRVYTGVLYDALGLGTLSTAAKRRASARVLITSALLGVVSPGDRIPAYRLSGDTSLPGLGPVAAVWRAALGPVLPDALGGGLLIDLRSTTYAAFWRPPAERSARVATVRVLQEREGRRSVVSHVNKATKGRLLRALLEEGADPRTPTSLAGVLRDLGWRVEQEDGPRGSRLDVVVTET